MRGKKVIDALLIIVASTILFLLPITLAVTDFLTDQQEDSASLVTAVGQTSDNVSLSELLYDSDISSVYVLSDLSTDAPSWASYNGTHNTIWVSGLTANTTRVLTITYEIDALSGNAALINLVNNLPAIWLLLCVAFAPAALAALFMRRL